MSAMWQRYWHTLRHLRPVQVYGRLWFRLYRPRPDLRPAPVLRLPSQPWTAPLLRPVSMLGPARFRFLNQTQDADGPEAWNDPARDKLWLYNLHYFDDLNAQDAQARADWHRALIERWIAENPPGHGNGWEPYPTSLRMVNWVKYLGAEVVGWNKRSVSTNRQGPVSGGYASLDPLCTSKPGGYASLNPPYMSTSVIPAGKPESRPRTGNLAASTEAQQSNIEVVGWNKRSVSTNRQGPVSGGYASLNPPYTLRLFTLHTTR